ncbi:MULTISPECIES: aspartate--tRNA ligase [Aneurinibacillus]|uniref:Aspartate--tRNA ligase n=1 Tax=Aneurinibacillus thermoaerophilus TaxID=143495 RepID=A0A1G7YBE5_ANETH|nr:MULTISPECIES: aspartate--tRNA ligase [Aneurinibacillus]AMA72171.1 aspartate--tRNA ligase [Aneurinibacillus sp. XH2]MED0676456.1 aspartate--tRNA ligase [Aneurinibacillus thermoaerophilus]MED0678968.1 aspartate--tRNA ligase [Aneurinibacillus thermoaerophilus]MED0736505.1 aspartate--tRNA ligase [Aneurinibacillus thermoaerophilus]MED0756008.1 aspartate--tRNA ligase [Aneurinibacillus thermoaerophilus]
MEFQQRNVFCGTLRRTDVGKEVVLNGWVQKRRDLGGVIFVDLRDRTGIVQIVFNPEINPEAHAVGDKLRSEYVVSVKGKVVERDPETVNPNLETGEIEVQVNEIEIINQAKTPPFFIEDNIDVDEQIRLKYRYLDLRRPEMYKTMELRHKVTKLFRDYLDSKGFLEIETPMLTKSTPEGARDYLVPSRVNPGEFFALPQSPQIFKQLLMVAGYERYFQIVRCFRDEDLRADRQPEFTQVDIETSFLNMEELMSMMEEMMAKVCKEVLNIDIETPFQRLTYAEAMDRYGSDKPDLRFGMELVDISDIAENCGFQVFSSTMKKGGQVKGINVKGCAHYSRKDVDELMKFAGRYGAKGLAWMAFKDDEIKGPIAKFFTEEEIAAIKDRMQVENNDLLLFVADKPKVVADSLGALRLKFGKELGLIDESKFAFAWVVDFPLLEWDEEAKRYVALHHPFTRPRPEDVELFDTDPGKIRAQAYDMVLNGFEIGGGSMRIYKRDVQEKMFKALGFSQEEAQEKFGFLLDAFEYGTPPHGGIAFGLDRIVMILAGRSSLRDTIAFPKTASARDFMTDAPSTVDPKQLEELSIRVFMPKKSDDK